MASGIRSLCRSFGQNPEQISDLGRVVANAHSDNGIFPIKSSDRQVEEFYQNSIKKGNFLATNDVNAYSHASTIIVDINLDVQKKSDNKGNLNSFDVDLSPFKNAIRTIGKYCKEDVFHPGEILYGWFSKVKYLFSQWGKVREKEIYLCIYACMA